MKTRPSEQNELPKLIPESVWGKWSMLEKQYERLAAVKYIESKQTRDEKEAK